MLKTLNACCLAMKLSLSTATAETTTFPKHGQTKQFLIILQNNGWHQIQMPWPLKVTSRTWTGIKCSFSSQTSPLGKGWTWSQSNFPPKTRLNSRLLLSRSQLKNNLKYVSLCVSLKHEDVVLPYIHVEEIWQRYTRIVKHLMMGTA